MWGKLLCNYYTIFQQKANLFHLSVGENANRFSVSVECGTPERWGFNVSFVWFLTCGIQAVILYTKKSSNDTIKSVGNEILITGTFLFVRGQNSPQIRKGKEVRKMSKMVYLPYVRFEQEEGRSRLAWNRVHAGLSL